MSGRIWCRWWCWRIRIRIRRSRLPGHVIVDILRITIPQIKFNIRLTVYCQIRTFIYHEYGLHCIRQRNIRIT